MPKRGRGKKADQPGVVKFTPKQLVDAVADTVRLQNQQSEYGGFASRQKAAFCKKHGFDTTVFGWLAKLRKLDDELKAQSLVEQFLLGVEAMGIVRQGDLFSEASKISERIRARLVEETDEGEPDPTGDEALATFQRRLEENVDKAPTPEQVDAQTAERAQRRRRRDVTQPVLDELPEGSPTADIRAEVAKGDAKIRDLCGRKAPGQDAVEGNDVSGASVAFPDPPARPQPPAGA
ncbi:hypothetical protein [Salinarimonas soli]|uniref:Terminase n=1 Tax=Salinarimonas soli TaxID=1638099 RepID=A0A5B2VFF9_9HYPH|nr:hypothetical protein [Salinarimonas soli]KAA2237704.1 hypothetical protein F0L46_08475 [Salinarimonas soli]